MASTANYPSTLTSTFAGPVVFTGTVTGAGGLVGKTLFVDSVNGNNGTAISGSLSKPYLTVTAAKTAAVSGDVMSVGPGTFDETQIAKNGVSIEFTGGTTVSKTLTTFVQIIDDIAGPLVLRAVGPATFDVTSSGLGGGPIFSVNPATVLDLDLFQIISRTAGTAGAPCLGHHDGGIIRGYVTKLNAPGDASDYGRAIYWEGEGHLNLTCKTIEGGIAGNSGANADNWYITADEYSGSIGVGGPGPTAAALQDRVWLKFTQAGAPQVAGKSTEAYLLTATDIFVYLDDAQKLIGPISLAGTNSEFYITAQKHTHASAATVPLLELAAGKAHIDYQAAIDTAGSNASVSLVKITAGEHWVNLGETTKITASNVLEVTGGIGHVSCYYVGGASAKGALVTGGTLRLGNSTLNTTANASTTPIAVNGGVTIYLKNVHLQSGAAACISRANGSGTVTVVCLGGCTANVDVGANVTVVGTLTVNASFA